MKKIILIFLIWTTCLSKSFAQAVPGKEAGGADAFDVGGGVIKVFDQIEYEEPFYPPDEPAYKEIIAPQLDKIGGHYPQLANYMRFIFRTGAMWFFVRKVTLKEVETTGDSPLTSLTYQKIQAGVTKEGITHINGAVWDALPIKAQAYLLFHEMLWSAETNLSLWNPILNFYTLANWHISDAGGYYEYGVDIRTKLEYQNSNEFFKSHTTSSNIRKLTGMFMNPFINNYEKEPLYKLLKPAFAVLRYHHYNHVGYGDLYVVCKQDTPPPAPAPNINSSSDSKKRQKNKNNPEPKAEPKVENRINGLSAIELLIRLDLSPHCTPVP
jgi:hypothetical protein